MADTKISALTQVGAPSVAAADVFPVVSGAASKKIRLDNLLGAAILVGSSTAVNPAATTGASQAGAATTVKLAPDAVASTDTAGAAAGGTVTLKAGDAARLTSGNANGGDLVVIPGAGIGTGTQGKLIVRKSGGVAGTNEIQIHSDDASYAGEGCIDARSTKLLVRIAGTTNFWFANGTCGPWANFEDPNQNAFRIGTTGNITVRSAGSYGFNSGSGVGSQDVAVTRGAAGSLKITDGASGDGSLIAAKGIATAVKAGTPSDADVTNPVSGMLVVDTTASKIWVRVGSTWKSVAVA
jgi:hypothetical protein